MPIKPLSFKGDKKPSSKKRKNAHTSDPTHTSSTAITSTTDYDIPHSEDDSWTTPSTPLDLSGPLLIVLPTTPPTCLASDAHGSVFASPLENIIEGNPDTAEPHDVRQVWVVTGVPGSGVGRDTDSKEKERRPREINLKATHGGYLSCDVNGVIGARREARGREESWFVEYVEFDDEVDEKLRGKTRWRLRSGARPANTKTTSTKSSTYVKDESTEVDQSNEGPYLSAISSTSKSTTSTTSTLSLSLSARSLPSSHTAFLTLRMQTRFLPLTSTHPSNQQANKQRENKVSRPELERAVGRKLEDAEVRELKRAKRDGTYHESILDLRAKGRHDKFA